MKGWLSREGRFVPCRSHLDYCEAAGVNEELCMEKMGWAKITCLSNRPTAILFHAPSELQEEWLESHGFKAQGRLVYVF